MTTLSLAQPAIGDKTMAALSVEHLSVRYGDTLVLDDVSFSTGTGELIGIIGPNGAGKTSLIKALLRLVPASGTVLVGGRALGRRHRRVAYVPQINAVNWRF